MSSFDIDSLVVRLLPQILADRDLGNGRTFPQLHLRHLWALLCLHAGEYVDEVVLTQSLPQHLPASILMESEIPTPSFEHH
jgi:hypothetical protein